MQQTDGGSCKQEVKLGLVGVFLKDVLLRESSTSRSRADNIDNGQFQAFLKCFYNCSQKLLLHT